MLKGRNMTQFERIKKLVSILLDEMPYYKGQTGQFAETEQQQRDLLRALMNVREPAPISAEFIKLQDEFLQGEARGKGIVNLGDLKPIKDDDRIYIWQGDITRLAVDAIVNAANSALLGCFIPCHACIDNAIHSAAGLQLRQECNTVMTIQRVPEKTGTAKITLGYNLPSEYVIHTVGPIIEGELKDEDCELLSSCYKSCMNIAKNNKLKSIAFCCVSTGEFHFPNEEAAKIAIKTVRDMLAQTNSDIKVIFNVFKQRDLEIYKKLLGE